MKILAALLLFLVCHNVVADDRDDAAYDCELYCGGSYSLTSNEDEVFVCECTGSSKGDE